MQFVILINGTQEKNTLSESASQELMRAFQKYTEDMKAAGVMKHGDALHGVNRNAKRILVKDGKRVVIDGPFAEAKEVVGGYYQIETKTVEEALAWAEKCPGVGHGTIELREVIVW